MDDRASPHDENGSESGEHVRRGTTLAEQAAPRYAETDSANEIPNGHACGPPPPPPPPL